MVMPEGDWFFDDRGHLCAAGSASLAPTRDHLRDGSTSLGDFVSTFGYVAMRVRRARVAINLRIKNVSSTALAGVLYWLADHRPHRIIVNFDAEQRPAEIYSDADTAIARLAKVTGSLAFRSRFHEVYLAVEDLRPSSRLRDLVGHWQNTGRSNPDVLRRYAERHLDGRYGISRVDKNDVVFVELGAGLQIPDAAWCARVIGHAVSRQPDADYWSWVAIQHRAAAKAAAPTLSCIDTEIFWPTPGWVHRSYARVLLPCVTPAGERLIFTANTDCGQAVTKPILRSRAPGSLTSKFA
jgi:hypothetical protein